MKLNKVFKALTTGLILALLCIPLFVTPVCADSFIPGADYVKIDKDPVGRGESITFTANSSFAGVNYTFFLLTEAQLERGAQGDYIGTARVTEGKLSFVYQIDSKQPFGKYYIKAIHALTHTTASDYYTYFTVTDVHPEPVASIDKEHVTVGNKITITGVNFPTNSLTQIKLDNVVVAKATTTSFQTMIEVTEAPYGVHHITVINQESGFSKEMDIFIDPTVIMFPIIGDPGEMCVATGTGFKAGTEVTFMIGTDKIGSVTTDDNGSFVYKELMIPKLAAGTYTIDVSDRITNLQITFTVNQLPTSISFSPAVYDYQTVGVVDASGLNGATGFVELKYKHKTLNVGSEYAKVAQGDANGFATGEFVFGKNLPYGQYDISLRAGGGQQLVKTYTVELRPTISVSKQSVLVGEEFTIEGWNFVAGSRLKLYLDDNLISDNISVESNCTFIISPKMISAANGIHTLTIVGDDITTSASISVGSTFEFQETTPSKRANVGTHLVTSGSGFLPNATVTVVALDVTDVDVSKAVTLATFKTDANGSFAVEFTITSALKAGEKNVTVSDGTNTYQAKLYMDNTAPGVPVLKAPANAERVRDKEQPITFGWNGAVDPSGVMYEFQLALDHTFTNVLIDKTTDQISVTLSAEDVFTIDDVEYNGEKLPAASSKAPYYWRVRAYDTVGNVGEWSTPSTFTTGFAMPNWIIWVYVGVGIVIVLILGVMVGRKLAYRSY